MCDPHLKPCPFCGSPTCCWRSPMPDAPPDRPNPVAAARRAREMHAELPEDQRDMLKLKGMM